LLSGVQVGWHSGKRSEQVDATILLQGRGFMSGRCLTTQIASSEVYKKAKQEIKAVNMSTKLTGIKKAHLKLLGR
jgi:hypothetical protein